MAVLISGGVKYLFSTVIVLVVDYYADVETGNAHAEERQVFINDFALYAFVFKHALHDVGLVYVGIFS